MYLGGLTQLALAEFFYPLVDGSFEGVLDELVTVEIELTQ